MLIPEVEKRNPTKINEPENNLNDKIIPNTPHEQEGIKTCLPGESTPISSF